MLAAHSLEALTIKHRLILKVDLLSACPKESQRNSLATVLTATISTIFTASTKETTKEVARPKAAPPLFRWRPEAATFVEAANIINIAAVKTVAKEFPWDALGRADSKYVEICLFFTVSSSKERAASTF